MGDVFVTEVLKTPQMKKFWTVPTVPLHKSSWPVFLPVVSLSDVSPNMPVASRSFEAAVQVRFGPHVSVLEVPFS